MLNQARLAVLILVSLALVPSVAVPDASAHFMGGWRELRPMDERHGGRLVVALDEHRILAAGGSTSCCSGPIPAAVLDVRTGRWKSRAAPRYVYGRGLMIREPGGTAVALGGVIGGQAVGIERYDPSRNRWSRAGRLRGDGEAYTDGLLAAQLRDGRVLVISNNWKNTTAEVYDPRRNRSSLTRPMRHPHAYGTLTVLRDGSVLVIGGSSHDSLERGSTGVERYHPRTGRWTSGSRWPRARFAHSATLLPDGRVLVVGGLTGARVVAAVDIYDPATDRWTRGPDVPDAVARPGLTVLADGGVLASGGDANRASAQAYVLDAAGRRWRLAGDLNVGQIPHFTRRLADGRVLSIGIDLPDSGRVDPPAAVVDVWDRAVHTRDYFVANYSPQPPGNVIGGKAVFYAEVGDADVGEVRRGTSFLFSVRGANAGAGRCKPRDCTSRTTYVTFTYGIANAGTDVIDIAHDRNKNGRRDDGEPHQQISMKWARRDTSLLADPVRDTTTQPPRFSMRSHLSDRYGRPITGAPIDFHVAGEKVCRARTDEAGTAICAERGAVLKALLSGGYRAIYAGDERYMPASAEARQQLVP